MFVEVEGAAAAARLRDGAVVAVKGLGGYHLAAPRARKHREDKPFAVMVADLEAAGALDPHAGRRLGGAGLPGPRAAAAPLARVRAPAR